MIPLVANQYPEEGSYSTVTPKIATLLSSEPVCIDESVSKRAVFEAKRNLNSRTNPNTFRIGAKFHFTAKTFSTYYASLF
jgi:hypothetical protein